MKLRKTDGAVLIETAQKGIVTSNVQRKSENIVSTCITVKLYDAIHRRDLHDNMTMSMNTLCERCLKQLVKYTASNVCLALHLLTSQDKLCKIKCT